MRFPIITAALGGLLLAACSTPAGDHGNRDPHHHAILPPELPKLPTQKLAYVRNGTTANFTIATHASRGNERPGYLAAVTGDRRIAQKVLLLGATGAEPAYLAAKAALDRLGVPYRPLIAADETLTAELLSDGVSRCHFGGVIIATGGLGFSNPSTGAWESAMTPSEWQELADFEAACNAREVVWYAYPSPDFGFAWGGPAGDTVDGKLTASGQTLFSRVKDSAIIPYRHAWGYRATIADPASTTALVEATDGGVLVASHVGVDGREKLVSTVDASPYLTHSIVLEYDFVRWVTRGLFVGEKRAYLAPQIDDLFLSNTMWVPGFGNDEALEYRITGTDIDSFVAWQTQRTQTLPPGSSFITDMAFNGFGTQTSEYADTTLLAASRAAGSKLTWLNHTWDHDNMDAMTRAEAKAEITKNCNLARTLRLKGFSCNDLVTPDMSGLGNNEAILGLLDAGVSFVVSDTSITEALRPGNPGTNPSFNVGRANPLQARLYHVPRHPTSIFYDVATPENETDEYNHIYRSYYGRDLSYEEVLDKDSEFGLYYLLQGDIDPLMFHQANLHAYAPERSLYADWIDAVVAKYLAYFDAPILTLSQVQIGVKMKERGKLNNCGLTMTLVEASGTRSLELLSSRNCMVPITGVAAPTFGTVDLYAGEPTTLVTLNANQPRTIPLP